MADAERYTCQDPEGRARLIYGVDLMDAIEHLARIEERAMGIKACGTTPAQQSCIETQKMLWIGRKALK